MFLDFPGGSDGKESACNAGDLGLISGLEDPLEEGKETHCSCLENPHGQRSLEGFSPWSHNELDMTERVGTAQHCSTLIQLC